MKIKCNICDQKKFTNFFWKDSKAKRGFQSKCISCTKEYRLINKEKYDSYNNEHYQKNRTKIIARSKNNQMINANKRRAYMGEYELKNKAKTTLNRKKYSLSEKGRLTNINKSHRQGQRNVVQTIHIAVGEVEERLMRALARKDATQAMLLESLK